MSLRLGSLYVSLSARTSGYMRSMDGAMKAAERFAKQTKQISAEVASASAIFAGLGIAAVKMAAGVDGPTKRAMDGLTRSTQVLAVQVADMLLPAVRELGATFRTAAQMVAGLDPEVKKQVSSFAVMAVQVAVAAKALSVFSGLAGNVVGVLRGGLGALAAIGLGPLLGIASALVLVAAGIAALHYAFRTNLGGMGDAWKGFADWFGDSARSLFSGASDWVLGWVREFIDGLREMTYGVGLLMNKLGKTDTANAWFGMAAALEANKKSILDGSFFKSVVTDALDLGKAAGTAFVDEWKRIAAEMGLDSILKGPAKGATIGLGRGMGPRVSGGLAMTNSMGFGNTIDTSVYRAAAEADARSLAEFRRGLDASRKTELQVRAELAAQLAHEGAIANAFASGSTAGLNRAQRTEFNAQAKGVREDAVGASSWSEAQKILSEGLKGAMTVGDSLSVWADRMGPMIWAAGKELLGAVGDLVDSIAQGAKQGGVWGALIAAFMEIAKKTESAMKFLDVAMEFVKQLATMVEPLVRPIFDALTNVLGIVVQVVAPVFEALKPLFEGIGGFIKKLAPILWAVGDLLQALSPIIELIGQFVAGFLDMISPVLDIIGGVIKVVATVILGIMIGLNELAAMFGDEKAKAESARLQGVVDAMWSRDARMAEAEGEAAGAALRNAAAQDAAADAATKASESLTNVPSGYRVALARYQADLGLSSAAAASGASGGTTINGDVYVTSSAETVDTLAEDARREAARERGQQRGNPSRPRGSGGRD